MKAIRSLALAALALFYIQATPPSEPSNDGIVFFEGTWEEALTKAEKEHKVIFLDAYAAWCGPCKLLKKNVFSDPIVGAYYNENFINMAIDMEKGNGPQLASKYGVRAYPTLIFVNGDGSVANKVVGYHNSDQLIELGKSVLTP
jgi:thioredoxin 1